MRILAFIIFIICSITLVLGNLHWKEKLENSSAVGAAVNEKASAVEEGSDIAVTTGSDIVPLLKERLAFLPFGTSSFIEEAASNQQTVELLILGSEANTMGSKSWTKLFQEKMEDTYGNLFHITVKEIRDTSSYTVLNEGLHSENLEVTPDLLILEPFLIKDNSVGIKIEQSIEHIEMIIKDFKSLNPELHVFLQPAHPLHGGQYYPRDVEKFREFVEQSEYTYINHWQVWPEDHKSAELEALLMAENAGPNDKGHEIWAEYVTNLFINEE
ncbi:SGNH/GDSL hydrolase family protein [Sutcliffiella sp. NPDC057660]|uniref:SGNH/GDSL hydrolase family protein n=1 Tax=Sutcliffiella sp. NPDC057660 TaxID=3346199 RepID=UPI0036C17ECF